MKFARRLPLFLSLIILMGFGTTGSQQSSTARAERIIDPACVSICTIEMQNCFNSGGKNGQCLGVYYRCVAHCAR